MWQAIVFGFLGGVLAANGYPHFTRGITKRRYPSQLGNGPVPNFVAGWAALVIAAVLFYLAHVGRHPGWSLGAAAVGVLLMGLFHAGPGAFGRPEPPDAARLERRLRLRGCRGCRPDGGRGGVSGLTWIGIQGPPWLMIHANLGRADLANPLRCWGL